MTQKRKKVYVFCIFFALILSLVYYFFFSGFILHASYSECTHYEDFDTVKADFERVAELANQHGNGYYSPLVGLSKFENSGYTEYKLSDDDAQCLERVKAYCRDNTYNKHFLDGIRVKDNYVLFEYEDFIGCGIVKASATQMMFGFGSGKGYTKLANGWYAYYR